MTTVFTVVGVTKLIYEVLERDYGVPSPAGGGSLGSGITTTSGLTQAQVQAIVDAAIANLPAGGAGGVTQAQVDAAIQQAFVDAGPAIQAAVASQVGKLTDRVTFNVSTAGDSPFVVETNNFTGAQHKVGVDFVTQRDGEVTVNGKRVLTVDDALEAAGGGIDQAAVEAAVAAATSSLSARVLQLETEMNERVTMANVQGLLTGFATAQQMTALTGRVTDLEGSTALRQARWVTEALTGDTTANSTQINNAVAGLARTAFVQEQLANATAYVDQLSSDVAGALDQVRVEYTQLVDDMITWAATAFTGKDQFQALLDAMNGPNADIPMIANMFRLLNDVIMALLDATGVPVPEDSKQAAEVMREKQQEEMRNLLTGGKDVPPNVDWTACKNLRGTGLVEARLINGTVQMRGELKTTLTSVGSHTACVELPAEIPGPGMELNMTGFAYDAGVAYRVAAVRIWPDKRVGISAPTGQITHTQFNGISYQVF